MWVCRGVAEDLTTDSVVKLSRLHGVARASVLRRIAWVTRSAAREPTRRTICSNELSRSRNELLLLSRSYDVSYESSPPPFLRYFFSCFSGTLRLYDCVLLCARWSSGMRGDSTLSSKGRSFPRDTLERPLRLVSSVAVFSVAVDFFNCFR